MRNLLRLIAAGALALTGFQPTNGGEGGSYWRDHSLVYAHVQEIDKRWPVSWSYAIVHATIRPIAVLSGPLDPGLMASTTITRVRTQERTALPSTGDDILLILTRRLEGAPGLMSAGYEAAELPGYVSASGTFFETVHGLSDPAVARAFGAVRSHRGDESPEPNYVPCVAIGELKRIRYDPFRGTGALVIKLKAFPAGGPSGISGQEIEISVDVDGLRRANYTLPAVGTEVLAWFTVRVATDHSPNAYGISLGPVDCRPPIVPPVVEVRSKEDPKAMEFIKEFRRRTFWATHSLVCADVVTTHSSEEPAPGKLEMRPRLTIAGRFEATRLPELTVSVEPTVFRSRVHNLYSGGTALIVLTQSVEGYSVTADPTPFMPGDHGPICTLKDFDDPIVKETLEAVQKVRHAGTEAEPENAPEKH